MSQLILHHYPLSPFSEKVRALLGYSKVPWLSAITREAPPRPILEQLAGGYRKVPVAQIGADIFCDTRTICAEIAALAQKPELVVENADEACQRYVEETELKVFFACLRLSFSWRLNRKVMRSIPVWYLLQMIWDRIQMGRSATVRMPGPHASKAIMKQFLDELENQLSRDFIFGSSPSIADFSTYPCLWFYRQLAEKAFPGNYPRIEQWMGRIKQFGHGNEVALDPPMALEMARNHEPRMIDERFKDHPQIGRRVVIAPTDYAQTGTVGTLVGSLPQRWIIARQEATLGTVHVHFPKYGFSLVPA